MTDTPPNTDKRLPLSLFLRLSTMMALQWALWMPFPFLYPYLTDGLGFTNSQSAFLAIVAAIGVMFGPFAGQAVDRWVSTEKYLAASHTIGAGVVFLLYFTESFWPFFIAALVYSLLYGPTIALTNSLCFHHLPDRDRHFGIVRVCGAVGFIPLTIFMGHWLLHQHKPGPAETVDILVAEGAVAQADAEDLLKQRFVLLENGEQVTGELVSDESAPELVIRTEAGERKIAQSEAIVLRHDDKIKLRQEKSINSGIRDAFALNALVGLLMGLYCLTLPHTPPRKGHKKQAFAEALGKIRYQPLITLFVIAVPISCIHQFYFFHTAKFINTFDFRTDLFDSIFGVGGGGMMTIGQMSEMLVMATIGFYAAKFSRKSLLLLGLLAYVLRFAFFAYAEQLESAAGLSADASVIIALLLHGPCYTWFMFLGYMIVDEETTSDVRGSAQSLYNLVLMGIGIIVGSLISGWIADFHTVGDGGMDYTGLFTWPFVGSLVCMIALAIFYPGGKEKPRAASE